MRAFQILFVLTCLLLGVPGARAAVLYVDVNGTNSTPPYSDWTTAATNIQDAIDAAASSDLVTVTDGVYQVGGRVIFGSMTNRVAIYKPITVQSVNGPAVTTIRGLNTNANNAMRCVYLTNGATLSGFTLTNGATRIAGDSVREGSGGGLWCEDNSALVSNCVVAGCSAAYGGGGAYRGRLVNCMLFTNNASFGGGACSNNLVNCLVVSNQANNVMPGPIGGGGAFACTLSNCTLSGNRSQSFQGSGGGAIFSMLTSCTVSNNSAGAYGGGLFGGIASGCLISSNRASLSGGGACSNQLINCTLTNNFAQDGGAAAFGTLTRCLVRGNTASGGNGGGAYQSTADDCIFTYNVASSAGHATYSGNLRNCTVVSNGAPSVSAVFALYGTGATNCIVYDNPGGNIINSKMIAYTCTTPAGPPGNFTNAPLFVNEAAGDFHLQATSPCISSGYNPGVAVNTDFDGNPRLVGTVDMGAYEYQTPGSIISYAWLQQYGLPTDGSVDFLDLDGTGWNNLQKFLAGLNPTNPASIFALQSPAPTNNAGGITVTWLSVNTRTYLLLRSSDLSLPFSTIHSNLFGQTGTTSYKDTSATNHIPYYYRVGVQ